LSHTNTEKVEVHGGNRQIIWKHTAVKR